MAWSFWAAYLERLGLVALLLGLLYLIARRLRSLRFFSARSRSIAVIESAILSQHAAVHVVRVGARYFALGTGVARLAELSAAELNVEVTELPDLVTGRFDEIDLAVGPNR